MSLFICNTVVCEVHTPPSAGLALFDFQNNQDWLNDPKGNKMYNLHYDDVRGDLLHDTTPDIDF